jgi:putative tricarboxylic transport membrane protein
MIIESTRHLGSGLKSLLRLCVIGGVLAYASVAQAAWEPTKSITFVVTGGPGGGADQMARLIQGIVSKYKLSKRPIIVVIENGGGGGQGFLDIKNSAGDPHKIAIVLSNLYSVPLSTDLQFNWRDTTPVALMALDEFVLWVNAQSPYKTTQDYIAAVKAKPGDFKMGGAGSKREDEIVTAVIEHATGTKFTFIPYKGGGEIATQLVGGHIDSDVNNPIEHIAHWRAGEVRPLCVFDIHRMPFKEKVTKTESWNDIPTCRESGIAADYLMLRGILMPKGVTADQLEYYVNLLRQVREKPEWKEFVAKGAYKDEFLTGNEFSKFLEQDEQRHKEIMKKADFLAQSNSAK